MKMRLLFLLLLGSTALAARARTFTSADGRSLEGEIVDSGAATVTIRRTADGKLFNLDPATLSQNDQQEVARWRAAKAVGKILITATKDKVTRTSKTSETGGTYFQELKIQNWCWKITLKNGTRMPITGLKLNYQQIIERSDRGKTSVNPAMKDAVVGDTGSLNVPDIPPFGSVTLETKGIAVQSYRAVSTGSRNGAGGASADKWDESLSGLGVQLLLQDAEVRNWKTGTDPKGKKLYSR
jgi:hypothetical protein